MANMKEERRRYGLMKSDYSLLRTRLIEHYGHRLTGPGDGVEEQP